FFHRGLDRPPSGQVPYLVFGDSGWFGSPEAIRSMLALTPSPSPLPPGRGEGEGVAPLSRGSSPPWDTSVGAVPLFLFPGPCSRFSAWRPGADRLPGNPNKETPPHGRTRLAEEH